MMINIDEKIEFLKYPIGKYQWPSSINETQLQQWMHEIEQLPNQLHVVVKNLTQIQLDTPYRENGWTVRQVVHHLPDSYMNAYIRFKWTLTEEYPTIKTYFEDKWANLIDAKTAITLPLDLLNALHKKWIVLLQSISIEQFDRTFFHLEQQRTIAL